MKPRIRLHVRLDPPRSSQKDWTFDDPDRVTIGFLSTCSIWLMDADAAPSSELFRRRGKEFRFRIRENLEGNLKVGKKEVSLSALRDAGALRSDRQSAYVVVQEKTTGQFQLGSTKIRFWITPSPEEPEFPLHPAPLRIVRNIPRLFTAALLLSTFLTFTGIHFVKKIPVPPRSYIDEMDRQVSRFLIEDEKFMAKKARQRRARFRRRESMGESSGRSPDAPATRRLLAAVTRSKPGASSPFANLFTTDSIGEDLDALLGGQQLGDVLSKQLRTGRGSSRRKGAPDSVDIGAVRSSDLPAPKLGKKIKGPVMSRLTFDNVDVSGTLDPDVLLKIVQRNSGQLRDCYERALSRRPELSGRMVVQLMVDFNGKPQNVKIPESSLRDSGMERCIVSRVSSWTFPQPKNATPSVRFPLIFTASTQG